MMLFRRYELVLGFLLAIALSAVFATFVPNKNQGNQQANRQTDHSGHTQQEERESFWVRTSNDPTAFFTASVALFTLVLAGSTIGLWIETARARRQQARETRELERAYVYLDGFDAEITTFLDGRTHFTEEDLKTIPKRYQNDPGLFITRFAVLPRWRNGGNTPTQDLKIQVGWRGPEGIVPPEYKYRNDPTPLFLAPKATERSDIVEIPEAVRLVDWSMNPVGTEPNVWIWGRADYRDVFGESRFVEWCYRIRFERHKGIHSRVSAQFLQWGDHNRSS